MHPKSSAYPSENWRKSYSVKNCSIDYLKPPIADLWISSLAVYEHSLYEFFYSYVAWGSSKSFFPELSIWESTSSYIFNDETRPSIK